MQGWVRRWAAPLPGSTWAWADSTWCVEHDHDLDHPVIVRIIDYIWCRNPSNPYDTNLFFEAFVDEAEAASAYTYWDAPPTDDEARRLCAQFDARDIRWLHPRPHINRTLGAYRTDSTPPERVSPPRSRCVSMSRRNRP